MRLFAVAAVLLCSSICAADTLPLSSLDLSKIRQGWGKPQINKSMRETTMSIAGRTFDRGVATHAASRLYVNLGGNADRFTAWVGVDDAAGGDSSLRFRIIGDGRVLFQSPIMRMGAKARRVDIPLTGVQMLLLKVDSPEDATNFDHANWAEAEFETHGRIEATELAQPKEDPYILTPRPGPEPRINTPAVYGCRPGNPFIYRIPATGARPMQFSVEGLPATLKLDAAEGIITGTAPERGEHPVTITATNAQGSKSKPFGIVSGDTLSLTPYMGWNHWYAHYNRITDQMIREAADAMVASGMADAGYSFVSIDDCWMRKPGSDDKALTGPVRDEKGYIIPNSHFPDMKALTDYIHSKGLKAGTYTSPGEVTCSGYEGAWEYEKQDAEQVANWGFDLLKYDLCSYRKLMPNDSREEEMKPYTLMGRLLKEQKRDIIYNLCQYGRSNVWEWGDKVQAHSWRTAGDLGFELDRIFPVAFRNAEHRAWQRPGNWNDPDYVQIGWIGQARGFGEPRPAPLTPTEQYSFMSMWCLSAVPLMYSGDMTKLDDFTLSILCNPEAIEVNQDELGQCAAVSPIMEDVFLMVKEMSDGTRVIGICNGSDMATTVTATWPVVGVNGPQVVRDLWLQKDLGTFDGEYTSAVASHEVKFLRLRPAHGKAAIIGPSAGTSVQPRTSAPVSKITITDVKKPR